MSQAPARVVFTSGFSRRYTGGVTEFAIEAKTLRGVIKAMDTLFPGLGDHLEEETTVAIDGELHEVGYFQPVKPGAEVFFIPKIEGG
jgi:molybdopterin synthase sulfur carrier subunit